MTAHAHDQFAQSAPIAAASARPRWLLPAVIGSVVVGGLVVLGLLPPSLVLYGGFIGGMLLMHSGGHGGHGGHASGSGLGGHGGHGGGAGGPARDDNDVSRRSPASQPGQSSSGEGLDERATNDPMGSETHDHDQRSSHSCH